MVIYSRKKFRSLLLALPWKSLTTWCTNHVFKKNGKKVKQFLFSKSRPLCLECAEFDHEICQNYIILLPPIILMIVMSSSSVEERIPATWSIHDIANIAQIQPLGCPAYVTKSKQSYTSCDTYSHHGHVGKMPKEIGRKKRELLWHIAESFNPLLHKASQLIYFTRISFNKAIIVFSYRTCARLLSICSGSVHGLNLWEAAHLQYCLCTRHYVRE